MTIDQVSTGQLSTICIWLQFAWLIGDFQIQLCKLYLLFSLTSLAVARALLDHDEKKPKSRLRILKHTAAIVVHASIAIWCVYLQEKCSENSMAIRLAFQTVSSNWREANLRTPVFSAKRTLSALLKHPKLLFASKPTNEPLRTMSLSNDELKRYGRQLILNEIGKEGQLKLKASSVLIVGCGGLGCPSSMYLAAAGVGKHSVADQCG